MDARAKKLSHFIPAEEAIALVAKGYDTPKKIRAASDSELRKYSGLTQERVAAIRKSIPPFE